jgi:tetratricopeptide (TPR) repeat protein
VTTGLPIQNPTRAEIAEVRKKVGLYLSVGRFDAAEKLLKATLSDFGPLANVHNLLGVTYHKQSKFVDALREFNRALTANPDFVEAALNLAATLCDLSRYDEARAVFQRLSEQVNPKKRQPNLVLGRLANQHAANGAAYEESGMHADAIGEYRKALSLFERMPDVKLALAKLYVRVGQHDKARQEFEEIVRMSPDVAGAHTWLGILYYKLGRRDLARRHWEKAQQVDPNDLSSRAYLKLSRDWSPEPPPPTLHQPGHR